MDRVIGRARLNALLQPCPACGRGTLRLFPVDGTRELACSLCVMPGYADLAAAYEVPR